MASLLAGAVSGGLLVLSLPKPDLYPLAWIALAPLCWVIASARLSTALLSSYLAGLIFFAGTCYWITETMFIYGGLSRPTAFGVAALFTVVHGLYFVLFAFGVRLAIRKFGPKGLLFAPPLWVSIELLRSVLFSGFPWMFSGYALAPFSGALQIVTWTGIYGLSFLATAVNAMFALGFVERSGRWIAAAAAVTLIASLAPLPAGQTGNASIAVRLVQTNIALDQGWAREDADPLLAELAALSANGASRPRLVVWPETPAPFYLKEDANFRARMQTVARTLGAYFLLGYIDTKQGGPTNSAALLNPQGEQVSRYDKMHLVPFGEYIPLKRLLFFAEGLMEQVGEFMHGTDYTVSLVDGHPVSTIICYESIFPDLVRQFPARGAQLIVLITNDGWFGRSSAPYQHLRMGMVRAVENRRYIVRAANTGISAIIDPYGRIESATPLGVRTIVDGTAYFRSDRTFYTRFGDVFAYLNVLAALTLVGIAGGRHARRID